ncbi:hypothetical protein WS62_18910 [Burkholderia sp. ABCPW 14]|nr:hypothetical protein WS62_18910 [Burkholderia sp. ABCPW 14]
MNESSIVPNRLRSIATARVSRATDRVEPAPERIGFARRASAATTALSQLQRSRRCDAGVAALRAGTTKRRRRCGGAAPLLTASAASTTG